MKIVVDAMGGDFAPGVVVDGAVEAAKLYNKHIILIGDETGIRSELKRHKKTGGLPLSVVNATEVIGMGESAAESFRKKPDSSIVKGLRLLAEGKADGFFSAGHSGAIGTAALFTLKRLDGVSRPGLATVFPTMGRPCVLIDSGANIDSKPKNLMQFAVMGTVYSRFILNNINPRVGLLSIGEEDSKGNELTLEAFKLLKESEINFAGNIEGRDIVRGEVNVIVCDGFVGNIVLKLSEGLAGFLVYLIKNELKKNPLSMLAAPVLQNVFKHIKKKVDYDEQGGALLLGVNGVCVIGHGSSNAKAIKNGIRTTIEAVENNVNNHIQDEIIRMGVKNGN